MKKLLFIFNAKSGKARIKNHLADVIDMFVKEGYTVEAYPTQSVGDARNKVESCGKKFDLIVCSGGDGTLNEVISGAMMLDKRPDIGYIPSGSTNDFGTSINLPKSIMESAKIAVSGTPVSIDIGHFNDRNFVYIAGFGTFTDVSYLTPQKMKNALGYTAYLIEGAKKLNDIGKSYRMRIEYDGRVIEDNFIYGMITNTKSVAGFKLVTGSKVSLNDGLYEVTLIKEIKNPLEIESILESLVNGRKKSENVYRFKASNLTICSKEPVAWVLDGESGGVHKKVEISNGEKAVRIMSGIGKKALK